MHKIVPMNYHETLIFIINLSGLSSEDFADKAKISISLIQHANDTWNPKYSTIEKICSVVNISVASFFAIAENIAGINESITIKYVINKEELSPLEINNKLKKIRNNSNLSEAQLAKISGINKTNICNREHGKIKNQMLCSTLEKYAYSFGITMSVLTEKLYKED